MATMSRMASATNGHERLPPVTGYRRSVLLLSAEDSASEAGASLAAHRSFNRVRSPFAPTDACFGDYRGDGRVQSWLYRLAKCSPRFASSRPACARSVCGPSCPGGGTPSSALRVQERLPGANRSSGRPGPGIASRRRPSVTHRRACSRRASRWRGSDSRRPDGTANLLAG